MNALSSQNGLLRESIRIARSFPWPRQQQQQRLQFSTGGDRASSWTLPVGLKLMSAKKRLEALSPMVVSRVFSLRSISSLQRAMEEKPNPTCFSTPQSLCDWLRPRILPESFASWGVEPGTKNVHNLWLELTEGESSFLMDAVADSTAPPVRTLECVVVRIHDGRGRLLLESHQELSDGSIRRRCQPLSEKMKRGETVEKAVFRAIREELGSIIQKGSSRSSSDRVIEIVQGSYKKEVAERVSKSYPGLPCCYVAHLVDAKVVADGLPEGEFCTEEEDEYEECSGEVKKFSDEALSVRKHYWKWADPGSADC